MIHEPETTTTIASRCDARFAWEIVTTTEAAQALLNADMLTACTLDSTRFHPYSEDSDGNSYTVTRTGIEYTLKTWGHAFRRVSH